MGERRLSWFDQTFVMHFSTDGWGADTVGFGAFLISNSGLPADSAARGWTVFLDLSDEYNIGRTICIDSAYYPPGGEWLWSMENQGGYNPYWSGPYCFDISSNKVTVQGKLEFTDYSVSPSISKPIHNVPVEIWDFDFNGWHDSLGTVFTDDTGGFVSEAFTNVDVDEFYGQLDIQLRVKCLDNSVAVVTDDSASADPFTLIRFPDFDVDNGIHTIDISDTAHGISKYFYVLDVLQNAHQFAEDSTNVVLPDASQLSVAVEVRPNNSRAYPLSSTEYLMCIQDSVDENYYWPDTWQPTALLHEYGHIVAFKNNFCDSIQSIAHSWWTGTSYPVAAAEGFAEFFAGASRADTILDYYSNTFEDTVFKSLETGQYGWRGLNAGDTVLHSANCLAPTCEGTVACTWWDIIDNQSVLEEFSDSTQWGVIGVLGSSSDGVGDELTVPMAYFFDVLLTTYDSTGQRADNIEEFWKVWNQEGYGYQGEMHDILFEHGIVWGCCRGIRGNVDGDPDESINVSDMTFLVDYLFGGGPPPPCLKEADVNADSRPNIADMTFVTSYLFSNGIAPYDCAGLKNAAVEGNQALR